MPLKTGEETYADDIFLKQIREIIAHPFLGIIPKELSYGDDCALVEEILVYLSKKKSMDSTRAQKILNDARKILAYMD